MRQRTVNIALGLFYPVVVFIAFLGLRPGFPYPFNTYSLGVIFALVCGYSVYKLRTIAEMSPSQTRSEIKKSLDRENGWKYVVEDE